MNKLEYYQHIHHTHLLNPSITPLTIIESLRKDQPFVFVKYGDGEVECIQKINNQNCVNNQNCDGDVYFPALGAELIEAFLYFVDHQIPIGKWHFSREIDVLCQIYWSRKPHITKLIPFTNYHLLMNDKSNLENRSLYTLAHFIKRELPSYFIKIVISNEANRILETLFSAHAFISTPPRSLYIEIDRICAELYAIMDQYPNHHILLITSCGLSAKVIIYRALLYTASKGRMRMSALDYGSSFDLLCKKYITRTYQREYTYEELYAYYQDLLDQGSSV